MTMLKDFTDSGKHLLTELAALRDQSKLRFHLLSLDARKRWQELETELDLLDEKAAQQGERASEVIVEKIRSVSQAAREFLMANAELPADLAGPVRSLMTTAVRTCSPQDSLSRAAQLLWETNCGSLPVLDSESKLVGMITDRDICMACYTQGNAPSAAIVEAAMSRDVCTCSAEDSIETVLEKMGNQQIRRIPVVDEERRLVGIISTADLARWIKSLGSERSRAAEALVQALASVSAPPKSQGRRVSTRNAA